MADPLPSAGLRLWIGRIVFLGLAGLIGLSVMMLGSQEAGLQRDVLQLDLSEVVLLRRPDRDPGPVVVVMHGFAGSSQLMGAYAIALARSGYTVASFDFLGHGRSDQALTGSLVETSGATVALLAQLGEVVDRVAMLPGAEQGVGLLGHSMAGDILVRQAQADPRIDGLVGISMYASTLTRTTPGNLLMIVGQFESGLLGEAISRLPVDAGEPGRTYGAFADSTARRAVVAPGVEHVSVLYSQVAVTEAVAWFDTVWGRDPAAVPVPARGLWLLVLLASLVACARGLAFRLPVLSATPAGACLPRSRFALVAVIPALLVPFVLWPMPTHVLPVLVADYLGFHFAAYGLITSGLLAVMAANGQSRAPTLGHSPPVVAGRILLPAALALLYGLGVFALVIDRWLTSFVLTPERWPLFWALLPGLIVYFLADAWATHGAGSGWQRSWATRSLFLLSVGIAVALDFEALFFLIIILPVIVLFFLVYGLMAGWVTRRTGHPAVSALASAVIFAWALAATFPLVSG